MPQPVDLQTELARVTAAERIQQIADRASMAAQHRTASELQREQLDHETVVYETHQPESRAVDPESHRQNPFAGRRRRRKPDQKPESAGDAQLESDELDVDAEQHHIDVSI